MPRAKARKKVSKKPSVTPKKVAEVSETPVQEQKVEAPRTYPRARRIVAEGYGRVRDGYDSRPKGYGRQTYH